MSVHDYTLHWVDEGLSQKLCGHLLLRRAPKGWSLLVKLVKTTQIVKATSEALSQFLKHYKMSTRKNASKTCKIRNLMQLEEVTELCSEEELSRLNQVLDAMDEKQKKKSKNNDDSDEGEDECGEAWKNTFVCSS